jgi:hypothetical protein
MTKQELHDKITELIESGELKARQTTIRAGNERLNITLNGWIVNERPTGELAALLLQATEFYAVVELVGEVHGAVSDLTK